MKVKLLKQSLTITSLIVAMWALPPGLGQALPLSQSCVPTPSGVISWWPGDGNGSDIGNGNPGVLQGGATFGNAKVGQGFIFSGATGERVVVPNAPNLNLESLPEATFEGWFKSTGPTPIPGDGNTDKVIVAKHVCGVENGWFFTTGQGCYFGVGNTGMGTGGINVTDGQFHHFACIKAGTTYREYIDGVLVMTKSDSAFGTPNNEAVQMGGVTSGTCNNAGQLNGAVDEITVYQTALSTSEVEAIVSAGGAGKCKNDSPLPPENLPPVADAGVSRQVKVGEQVVLDGSKSYDPEGQQITPSWSFLSRPAGSAAQLTGANTLQPSFVPDQGGEYKVRLDVTDPQGASANALVSITASSNRPPVAAIAPVSGSLIVPINKVLDGSVSSDPDGDKLSYKWKLLSKPARSQGKLLLGWYLIEIGAPKPTLSMDIAGDYVVELTVLDPKGLSGKTQVKVTGVAGAPPPPPPPSPNVVCRLAFGTTNGSQTTFYECNGKRITQEAITGSDLIDSFDKRDADSVATWRFGQGTGSTLASTGSFAYYANCTRNPSAVPVQITNLVFPPNTIQNFKIIGRTVTASVCNAIGSNCTPMQPRFLPVCAMQ